ncbi:response regulator [Nitratifractor salsuginis]|uniref:Response regulator receiver and Hpt phospho transfer protein n=1 Tax=Nitratifractor salsuginis (strain DSM 16511 / JCM 12458 / E9I37-1) TaxID=749222 RepID=E6X346_NITSE|nr:response regulator [Nitratifractor salsuginis]ADV46190.1 response regulator receiver and Hpt phospho transfer protein [Nitratifractor salsuginis DSM 16511]
MEQTSSTFAVSLPLLIGGGIILALILLYLVIRERRKTPSKRVSATEAGKAEEARSTTSNNKSDLQEPQPATPEKREEKPLRSSSSSEGGLPVHKEPIPETADVIRESFEEFTGRRLLIVEDNPVNMKLILKLLEGSGLEIETAENGQKALEKLRAPDARYEMVLMDVHMPVMDGLECTRQIRQDPQLKDIPVIALTASTQKDEVERILESGMNGYLDKPLVLGKLYSAFKIFLTQKPKQKSDRVMIAGEGEKQGLVTNANILDIRSAMAHTNNNDSLYRSLLDEFLKEYADCDQRFKQLVEAKEYEELHRLLIDLNGLTGMLGAMELYALVDRLKQIVEKGTHTLLEDYPSECHKAYQRFRREARRYLVH